MKQPLSIRLVEEGTQGLHYCRLVPYKDNPIAEEDQEIVQHLFTQGRQLAEYVSEEPGVRRKIKERYGPAPNDIEGFSLWLAAITPMSETDKLALLSTKDTKDRLQRAQLALGAYVSQQSANRQNAANGTGGLTGAVATAVRTMMNMIRSQSGSQDEGTDQAAAEEGNAENAHEDDEREDEEEDTHMSQDEANDDFAPLEEAEEVAVEEST